MSGTRTSRAPLTSYRDAVTELLESGEKFGDVEDAIDDVPELTQDEKAALWLFAFSLRDQAEQQSDAHTFPRAASVLAFIYLIGLAAVWLGPETKGRPLPE